MILSDADVERIAHEVAKHIAPCPTTGACCVHCTLTPDEHAEQHRAMAGALKMRNVVFVKIVEWGAVAIVVWMATKFGLAVK